MSDHHSMERHDDAPSSQCCPSGASYRLANTDIARIALAGLLVLAEYLNWLPIVGGWKLVGLLATATIAWPIFKEGAKAALRARMTMSLAMSIALVAALSLSEVFTALVITLSVLVAEEIEKFTIFRGKSSIARLLDLLPKTAHVRQGEAVVEVGVEQVHKGDVLVVKPGSRIVVDGVVVSGRAFVDESTITGESLPQEKLPGHRVYAGSISQSGALEVTAESVGQDTTFGKIIAAVSDAESNRGQMQKLSDRLAAYLVYFSLVMAAVTWFMTGDLRQTISVIIVSGACGIAAGTPLAIFAALGRTARGGTIVKGGVHIEQLATIDTVVFDKTGTLTQAAPRLLKLVPVPGTSESELLQLAVTAETLSEHPVARAIREAGDACSLTAGKSSNFLYLPGRGVLCTVDSQQILAGNRKLLAANGVTIPESYKAPTGLTEVLVAAGGVFKGGLYIGDRLRSDAAEAIRQLQKLGLKVMILSGDAESAVARVAEQLGVSDFAGALVPEEKLARIKQLVAQGHRVAMVGDGVNDAPALAEATVGVAMGSGTDVAQESADVVLIGSGLLRLVDAIKVARQCKRVIMFNFAGTILIDAIGMALAFAGLLSPILAALVHVGSEVAFLVNSARLLPWFRKE